MQNNGISLLFTTRNRQTKFFEENNCINYGY